MNRGAAMQQTLTKVDERMSFEGYSPIRRNCGKVAGNNEEK